MAKLPVLLLGSLRAFEATARLQSISKAGKELHVTRPAISRRIKDLERRIGRDLFERRNRLILLNDAGRVLFDAVTTGFGHIERAVVQLSGDDLTDRLVISVDPDFAGLWLVPRLAEFYAIAPHTLVEIRAERIALPADDPQVSCVIQYAAANQGGNAGELLFRSLLFPVCAGSLLDLQPLASLDDLRYHFLLHDRSTDEWEEYLCRYAAAAAIDVESGAIFNNNALCLDAAARGLGVAIGDDCLAAKYLSEGRLIRPFDGGMPSPNAYYLMVSERWSKRRSVAAFRRWLLGSLGRGREQPGHG